MAKFATAADALAAQLTAIDAKLANIEIGTDSELYLELSYKRAAVQQALLDAQPLAYRSQASLTRAANTVTYAANDVVFGAFELPNIGRAGGTIAITDIRFLMNITYLPSGIGNLRLFLYSVTPPSAVADNGAFSVPSGDRASILTPVGISLGTPALALGGGSLVLAANKVNQFFTLTSTSLFGYLVTEGAWVPTANSETATLTVQTGDY